MLWLLWQTYLWHKYYGKYRNVRRFFSKIKKIHISIVSKYKHNFKKLILVSPSLFLRQNPHCPLLTSKPIENSIYIFIIANTNILTVKPFKWKSFNFFRLVRYHLGTVAFGSFIIALIQLIRIILNYIESRVKVKTLFCTILSLESR